jgi:hypothetical protein
MEKTPDFRDYINPDYPQDSQLAILVGGTTYKDIPPLMRSLRPGSIVRVARPAYLAPKPRKGYVEKAKRIWAERATAIEKKKGVKLISAEPPLTGNQLAMQASIEISRIAMGRAGVGRNGRPRKPFSDDERRIIEQYWPPRRGVTVEASEAAINKRLAPRKVTRGWLYKHYPVANATA